MKKSRGSYKGFATVLSAVAILAILLATAISACAQTAPQVLPYTTTTAAGQLGVVTNPGAVPPITPGDGGPALSASFSSPRGVSVDALGNIYIADTGNNLVRKVDAVTGIITTVAGGGAGSVVDGSPALSVSLNGPRGVFADAYGNLWIDESSGNRIDKVTPDGILHVIARSSKGGYGGDGTIPNLAGTVIFYNPETATVDQQGNVYIADAGNCIIRKVSVEDGKIYTVVGKTPNTLGLPSTGTKCTASTAWTITPDPAASGVDCAGANAPYLGQPYDVAVDKDGNIFYADNTAYKVRVCFAKTTTRGGTTYQSGKIYTIVGTGNGCTTTSAPNCGTVGTGATFSGFGPIDALTANIGHPVGLVIDQQGNFYFSDSSTNTVYYYDFDTKQIRVVAGYGPQQPATPPSGSWYWTGPYRPTCDNLGYTVPSSDPKFSTIYGDGCPGPWSRLSGPQRLALDPAGNLYVVEQNNYVVRKILSGTQFAPVPVPSYVVPNGFLRSNKIQVKYAQGDGPAASTPFSTMSDFTVNPVCGTNPDGSATAADVCVVSVTHLPTHVGLSTNFLHAVSANGRVANIPLSGMANGSLAIVDPAVVQIAVAPFDKPTAVLQDQNANSYFVDGGANTVTRNSLVVMSGLHNPKAAAVDASGNIYVTDTGAGTLLKLNAANGATSTLVSNLSSPAGVAVDKWGNVYVADTGNNLIYRVDALTNQTVKIAGGAATVCTSASDSAGDGCPPLSALLGSPQNLAVDGNGNLYLADQGYRSIRKIDVGANLITKVSGSATMTTPVGVAVDAAGNIYFSDSSNHAVSMISAATGSVSTVIGTPGVAGSAGLGGQSADEFELNTPLGIATDRNGYVYVADSANKRFLHSERSNGLLYFGAWNVNDVSNPKSASFTNIGNTVLNFLSPCYSETGDSTQFIVSITCPATLGVGSSLPASAVFAPTANGIFADRVTLNGDATAPVTLDLKGQGGHMAPTTTTVVLNPTTAVFGQTVVATVTVAPTVPPIDPPFTVDGTVSCSVDGGAGAKGTLVGGSAPVSISGVPVGTHTIQCSYLGSGAFAPSSGSASLTVTAASTTTTLAVTPNPAVQYKSVCMTATLTAVAPGSGTPTGNVNFLNGATVLSTKELDADGVATYCTGTTPADALAPATYNMTARYLGDANFNGSISAAKSLTVTAAKPDFHFVFSTPNLVIAAGSNQASNMIYVTPDAFPNHATITFSCSNLPANSWCTFTPNTIEFTDQVLDSTRQARYDTDLPIVFAVTINQPSIARATQPRGFGETFTALAMLFPGMIIGAFGLMSGTRRRKSLCGKVIFFLTVTLLVAMVAGGLIGCGGSKSSGTTANSSTTTPTGTHTITVNATFSGGGTASHTISYPVVVQ